MLHEEQTEPHTNQLKKPIKIPKPLKLSLFTKTGLTLKNPKLEPKNLIKPPGWAFIKENSSFATLFGVVVTNNEAALH